MKDLLHTGGFLFIVCAIAGLALAATEQITAPRIALIKKIELEEAKNKVLEPFNVEKISAPATSKLRFLDLDFPVAEATKTVFIGFGADQKILGAVQMAAPKGYGGPIDMVVGLDPSGNVINLKLDTPKETPGLGTKLKTPEFLEKFFAQCKALGGKMVFKLKKDGGQVDGITAATISSRAFCQGIEEVVQFANTNRDKMFDENLRPPANASNSLPMVPTNPKVPDPRENLLASTSVLEDMIHE